MTVCVCVCRVTHIDCAGGERGEAGALARLQLKKSEGEGE